MREVHEKDIYIQFLGGASEVGATSIFIYWKGSKILIDSGKRRDENHPYPIFNEIDKDIDVFILTHLHQDHIGSLMECSETLKFKKILTSKENKATLDAILKDTQKIVKNNKNSCEELKNAYSDEKISDFIKKVEILEYSKAKTFKNFDLTFFETSHLIGSLGFLIENEEYSLLITSDFTESQKFFHPKTTFIEKLKGKKIDTLITETTYGRNENGDEVLKENCLNDLKYAIRNIFDKDEGNVLIPCFALGRMQEVILALLKLIFTGDIDPDTKIYLNLAKNESGYRALGMKITQKYFNENFEEFKNEMPKEVKKYLDTINTKNDILEEMLNRKYLNIENVGKNLIEKFKESKKSIFIIQPGMIGNVYEDEERYQGNGKLAFEIATGDTHGIIFVGYQAEKTVGAEIKNTPYNGKMNVYGIEGIKKNRNIYSVTFPGHVSIKGVKSLIENLNPTNVILVHGDIQASKSIAKSIKNKNIMIPEIDEKLYLYDNGKRTFFSMHHKFSRIIVDLENEYKLLSDNFMLDRKEYDEYPIMKLLKNRVLEYTQNEKLLHFEFLIKNEKSIDFFEKLKELLKERGISSNIRQVIDIEEITDLVADLISDTNEKSILYLMSYPFEKHKDFITLGQLADVDVYLNINDNFEKIPDLPLDINEQIKIKNKIKYDGLEEIQERYELLEKLKYYRDVKTKKVKNELDKKFVQCLKYDPENRVYRKNIFYSKDRSLWGDIENIFGIKNTDVVKDIENIYSRLGDKIEKIQMVNFIYSYTQNKEYREILGIDDNNIYGKYYLENGIQYFVIKLKENIKAKNELENIELQVELGR